MIKSVLRFLYWHIYKQDNFSQGNEEQVLQTIFSKTKRFLCGCRMSPPS